MKLYTLVKNILIQNEQARNSDKELIWAVLENLGITSGAYITKEMLFKMPSFESITRARRKVQEENQDLQANASVKQARRFKQAQRGTHIYREPITGHYEGNVFIQDNLKGGE